MARKLSYGNIIGSIFVIIFLASTAQALVWGSYHYYKIILRWPESYCNARSHYCIRPIKANFSIHGVWPMYFFDTLVKEFNQTGCTETTPTLPQFITRARLATILDDMDEYWPDVKHGHNLSENEQFWQYQWQTHGMCFEYPNRPLLYFQTGLSLMTQLDLLDLLKGANIFPDNSYGYRASVIKAIIETRVGEQVEIRCNRPIEGWPLQLHEVGVCFDREGDVMRCPYGYFKCNKSDMIQFPAPLVYN
ncbi:ribonuclease S-F11-like [Tripterygium wilfordii]|uniref:ribonuclease S-F11-like n=1 Tax=Tripterygium wilfordii TaxID=458696 RepID=UPI0018F86411|nr:ribonuclease S-F11-like [Tripterygium wilfordii]